MYFEIKFHLRANVTLLRDLVVHPGLVENSSESFHAWFMSLICYQSTESSFHQIIYLLDVLKSSGIQVTYFVLPVIPRFVTTKPGNRLKRAPGHPVEWRGATAHHRHYQY